MAQSARELPSLVASPTNTLTLQDVVLDSPVWRANVIHLEDQMEQFSKWIDRFIRMIKQYIESIEKHNLETSNLAKWTHPPGLDGSFLDPHVAGTVINAFIGTLQSDLAFKQKLASDLEETLLLPLQHFIKTELKDFREAKRQFDKVLDKYENQLSRYSILSKQKEPSALREDAFQTFDVRTAYTRACGDFFSRMIKFRSNLEHQLVQCFSGAMQAKIEEVDEIGQACAQIRLLLPGWRLWLEENKESCAFQLQKIQKSCSVLEDAYIRQTRPHRSLKRYSTVPNRRRSTIISGSPVLGESPDDRATIRPPSLSEHRMSLEDQNTFEALLPDDSSPRQGYLYQKCAIGKSTRYTWTRRWFFLQDGFFGNCTVGTINKVKGSLVVDERIKIQGCKGKINNDIDRRFCFEVQNPSSNITFLLQAETEDEMMQWLWAIEKQKELFSKPGSPEGSPSKLLQHKYKQQQEEEGGEDEEAEEATLPQALLSPKPTLPVKRSPAEKLTRTVSSSTCFPLRREDLLNKNQSLTSTLSTAFSLTSLMIREGTRKVKTPAPSESSSETPGQIDIVPQPSSSWGMPWLMSGINALANNGDAASISDPISSKSPSTNEAGQVVVWPTKLETETPKVKLTGYSSDLAQKQKELRKYFANVSSSEVVLQGFPASLYLQQSKQKSTDELSDRGSSTNDQASLSSQEMSSDENGFGYNGYCYVTQKNLWFYSCIMMTCVNTLVIPLDDIKFIQFDRASSATSHMFIETTSLSQRHCFGLWLESAEKIGEELRLIVETAKSPGETQLQALYDNIKSITPGRKQKTPVSHFTAVSALNAAVTPLNVQAHPSQLLSQEPMVTTQDSTNSMISSIGRRNSSTTTSVDIRGRKTSAATGALTAAMEAASPSKLSRSPPKSEKYLSQLSKTNINLPDEVWPDNIEKPTEPVTCGCQDHLDKKETEVPLHISAKRLFDMMFSESQSGEEAGSKSIWKSFNKERGNSDLKISGWSENKEGNKERILTYTMPVTNPMVKAKETNVIETHQILEEKDHLSYAVIISTRTPNLPYADAFIPCIKYCITYTSPSSCILSCSYGIKWLKSVMVKSMINRAANKGLVESIDLMIAQVKKKISLAIGASGQASSGPTSGEPSQALDISATANESHSKPDTANRTRVISLGGFKKPAMYILAVVTLWIITYISTGVYYRQTHEFSAPNETISWRGVYLRDLDQELAGQVSVPINSNPRMYQSFQDSRIEPMGWKYTWFSSRHRRMAAELTYTRERLGALRYELLAAFRMLNSIEQHIVESEYWNWLLDRNLQCENGSEQGVDGCEEVRKELSDH
ncbi:hypothetical protein J3Q64DRAFT_1370407 [Phycomyces blakesleeanus]|uniref:Uncharacterized protein n=2 Tax=Phycomyces blakesleeanus TaxID=4837 RepID=A0A162UZ77_PHYB8|nr:hypothetical protein PHYBLDRAFT_185398 [Phycomyces blakesleeanus NRRL 1555(-)]OAD78943.1 hypothetical protein PHYBLDRAFT_185398 [Phycomyces blakesleeanus NRRL 1555(-)]|eukprot:XP_018296983.1 hypothetical protein PHYBLDRAFT_185398 [Phycomyces blakesleeanus NRRL 1555(-)]